MTAIFDNLRPGLAWKNMRAHNRDAPTTSIEFSAVNDGTHFAFFHIGNPADKARMAQLIRSSGKNLDLVSETEIDHQPILIAKTAGTPEAILAALKAKDPSVTQYQSRKPFQPWAWRGRLSIAGQCFELVSVYLASRGVKGQRTRTPADNIAYLTYASTNTAASLIDIIFGAKKNPDTYRMRALKTQIDAIFQDYLPGQRNLPGTPSSPGQEMPRKQNGQASRKSPGQKLHDFVRRNSVYVETVLRYAGAFGLIFPSHHWKKPGWQKLNDNPFTVAAGLLTIFGKTVGLFSKVPDPYNPKPNTWLDNLREKVFFKFATVTEGLGAVIMAYNGFFGGGRSKPNPAGGIGNVLFMTGYTARWFAPFGVKETDLPALEAYIAERLATAPDEKVLPLTAAMTANLKKGLKDQPIAFGQIFTQILNDLNRRRFFRSASR